MVDYLHCQTDIEIPAGKKVAAGLPVHNSRCADLFLEKRMMKKKRKWIIPMIAAVLLVSTFLIYAEQYYHADAAAEKALTSDGLVQITQTDYGWFFDGPSETDALVFYPGGKVEETSYAPLLRRLAQEGMDVCLVKMPFRLAVFGRNKADGVMKKHSYAHWYIGGHSLGGVMASGYASAHPDQLDGVILFAAYSIQELSEDMNTILLYGSEDTVLNMKDYTDNRKNVPDDAAEHVIQGGNHAQFGSYGAQKGDGKAAISPEEQVEETVSVIRETITNDVRK